MAQKSQKEEYGERRVRGLTVTTKGSKDLAGGKNCI